MERSADGKHENCACCDVACKAHKESGETHHEHLLACKAVDHIAAERTHQKSCHGVAAQHNAYRVFGCAKLLAEIQWQQRREQVEGEIEQKVGGHHLYVVGVP